MPVIAAKRVLTREGIVERAEVVTHGGRIVEVRPKRTARAGGILVPGFVDLQVNGIDDVDVATADGSDWDRLDGLLLDQGVTSWCPTLVTSPLDRYAEPLTRITAASERAPAPRPDLIGAHLEGPFLGGAPGAHPRELLCPPDLKWIAALPAIVRMVTLAPELKGAVAAIRALVARGIIVSAGHSTATYAQACAAFGAGATVVTHLFNGMGPLHHREPGLAGAALEDDDVTVCLIADLVHVHPAVVGTAFRAKGCQGVALVTDAVAWRSKHIAGRAIEVVDGAPRLTDGTLAGSVLTMDRAVRNAVTHAHVPLTDAVAAASAVPARVLGLSDRGFIEGGRRADLVLLGDDLSVKAVWVGGEQVRG